ncbi:MAG TPA: cell envelope biogenesis protein TolA [Methylocystis sp.]|nr:cell envelope biogenesis protein TolA [Methylocystis sp.]
MSKPRKSPGFLISSALHAGVLTASLIAFANTPKFEDAQEALPVDVVTDSQLNQIAKGQKTAPPSPKPALHAEKPAAEPKQNPQEAKRDAPTPPPPLKRIADPSDDEAENKPPQEAAAPPKRVAALPQEKPAPTPPMRPQIKAEPEPVKDEPQEAEVVKAKPPEKPKLEKADAPTPPEKPKEKPRLKTDEVAKLLQQKKAADGKSGAAEKAPKAEHAAAKPKSGDETAPKSKFNAKNIATLLSHEAPQSASAGERTQLASLGAPTGAAPKMSASIQGKIDAYTVEHYRRCWATALSMNALTYVPRVEFRLSPAGALEGAPRLLNPSSNPVERARGEQALAAVRRCSPMPIPAEFQPYYDYWHSTELDMKENM